MGPGSSYKWSYNPHKRPYKWRTGIMTSVSRVITLLIAGTLYGWCVFSKAPTIIVRQNHSSKMIQNANKIIGLPSFFLRKPLQLFKNVSENKNNLGLGPIGLKLSTHPKFNSEFTPESHGGWKTSLSYVKPRGSDKADKPPWKLL